MNYKTLSRFLLGKARVSDEILKKLGDSLEIEPDEIDNPQPLKMDYGMGETAPERLRDTAAPESVEYWRRRALDAESKLSILRAGVHGLAKTVEGVVAASPPPSSRTPSAARRGVSSSASVEQAAGAMDLAEELAAPPPPESQRIRKADAPSGERRGPSGGAAKH